MMRWILIVAGILGGSAVAIGAFAAHGLEGWLERQSIDPLAVEKRLEQCEVSVRYHLLHALAILSVGLSALSHLLLARVAVIFWTLGIVFFSGGLYSMVFLDAMGHWAIVPSGGLCFLIGWMTVVVFGLLPNKSVITT